MLKRSNVKRAWGIINNLPPNPDVINYCPVPRASPLRKVRTHHIYVIFFCYLFIIQTTSTIPQKCADRLSYTKRVLIPRGHQRISFTQNCLRGPRISFSESLIPSSSASWFLTPRPAHNLWSFMRLGACLSRVSRSWTSSQSYVFWDWPKTKRAARESFLVKHEFQLASFLWANDLIFYLFIRFLV